MHPLSNESINFFIAFKLFLLMFNLVKPSFFFLDLLIFANSQYNTIFIYKALLKATKVLYRIK